MNTSTKATNRSNVGRQFKLIGRDEVFTATQDRLVGGFIPSVIGRSDYHETGARIADVVFLDDAEQVAWLASITTEAK